MIAFFRYYPGICSKKLKRRAHMRQPRLHSFITSAVYAGAFLATRPGRFISEDNTPVATEQETARAREHLWTFCRKDKSLDPTGNGSPDRPVRSFVTIPTALPQLLYTKRRKTTDNLSYTDRNTNLARQEQLAEVLTTQQLVRCLPKIYKGIN